MHVDRQSGEKDDAATTASIGGRYRVCRKFMHVDKDVIDVPYRGSHYTVCCPSCAKKFKAALWEHIGGTQEL